MTAAGMIMLPSNRREPKTTRNCFREGVCESKFFMSVLSSPRLESTINVYCHKNTANKFHLVTSRMKNFMGRECQQINSGY